LSTGGDVLSLEIAEVEKKEPNQEDRHPRLIASVGHTVRFIAIIAALGVAGTSLQIHLHSQASKKLPVALVPYKSFVPLCLSVILAEWALVFFVWRGIRVKGVKLRVLIGGSWTSGKRISSDLFLGVGIWIVSLFVIVVPGVSFLAGRSPHGNPGGPVLTHNVFEVVLWVIASVSAGFCEEVAFRGYLQRQFRALTGNTGVAVLLQAIVFGYGHAYEGLAIAIANVIFGLLFGLVAWWRKSLRPGMVAHAWTDIFVNLFPKMVWGLAAFLKP
jgi:membrane protease YdiL (CAAX protease family)